MTSQIKLTLPAGFDGTQVELDGVDHANAIRSIELNASAGHLPEVTLRLAMMGAEVDGEATLFLSAAQVGLLARFGWNAPDGAEVNDRGDIVLRRLTDPFDPRADAPGVSE